MVGGSDLDAFVRTEVGDHAAEQRQADRLQVEEFSETAAGTDKCHDRMDVVGPDSVVELQHAVGTAGNLELRLSVDVDAAHEFEPSARSGNDSVTLEKGAIGESWNDRAKAGELAKLAERDAIEVGQ